MSARLPYLVDLAAKLHRGCAGLPEARRRRHIDFVLSHREPDGSYRGREGGGDLYYTAFALRTLAMLGGLAGETEATAESLGAHDPRTLDPIDLANWLASVVAIQAAGGRDIVGPQAANVQTLVVERLDAYRTGDGGFAKQPVAETPRAGSSVYATFLATLAHELVGVLPPRPETITAMVLDRQRDDGGFVEIAPMRRSGTNPTAAAIVLLQRLGGLDRVHPDDLRDFFADVRTDGGLAANTRVPMADGLSTFTGLLACHDWLPILSPAAVRGFVAEQLELPGGGCRAAGWDDTPDVEYTFYGLGCLALCELDEAQH